MKDILEHRLDWTFDEKFQEIMAQTAGPLKDDFAKIVGLKGEENKEAIKKLINDKLIPFKAEDFAKLQKQVFTQGSGPNQSPYANVIKEIIVNQLKNDGRLNTNHLNSLANKNEESYYQLMRYLQTEREWFDEETGHKEKRPPPINDPGIKKSIMNHIIGGPASQVLAPETPTTTPTPPVPTTPGTPPP